MYGWRARVGMLLPIDNAVMEPELYASGLEGVSFHVARLLTMERDRMPEDGVRQATSLQQLGADVVVYACAETSFLKGLDANRWIEETIENQTGLPAVTAMSAMLEALRALQVRKISLVTPYTDERTRVMEEFFQRMGFETVSRGSRDFSIGSADSREWYETNRQEPWIAYESARKVVVPETEAIVISATNVRTFEVLSVLEKDTNRFVISTNQAILWAALGRLSLPVEGTWAGALAARPWTSRLMEGLVDEGDAP